MQPPCLLPLSPGFQDSLRGLKLQKQLGCRSQQCLSAVAAWASRQRFFPKLETTPQPPSSASVLGTAASLLAARQGGLANCPCEVRTRHRVQPRHSALPVCHQVIGFEAENFASNPSSRHHRWLAIQVMCFSEEEPLCQPRSAHHWPHHRPHQSRLRKDLGFAVSAQA